MKKKLYIKTYGCQMNVYDSSRMSDLLAPLGYEASDDADTADMVVLNTCHIREKAAEKVFSDLGRVRQAGEASGRRPIIAVAGCVAQAEGDVILQRAPFVDIVLGPQVYHRLPEMVARAERAAAKGDVRNKAGQRVGAGVLDTEFPPEPKFDFLPTPSHSGPAAFLAIQEGCDKFCTFCVVPYTRGAEYSRPVTAVLADAEAMVRQGAREITLLGQNVNAYHGEDPEGQAWSLGRLLRALGEIPGLDRLRYTTSHPRDLDDDLIFAHRDVPSLMPFLHLPVQSGSDRVLKAMNRGHTAEHYRGLVERLRAANPTLALSSDFIVGFPGEKEADFEDTLALVRDVGFVQAYSFAYSARPGTPASAMQGHVSEAEKTSRLHALQALLTEQQRAFNLATVGKTIDVLLDRPGKQTDQLIGRSPWMQPVHVDAPRRADGQPAVMGDMVTLTITAATATSLTGVQPAPFT